MSGTVQLKVKKEGEDARKVVAQELEIMRQGSNANGLPRIAARAAKANEQSKLSKMMSEWVAGGGCGRALLKGERGRAPACVTFCIYLILVGFFWGGDVS